MSQSAQFWQFAREAVISADQSQTEIEKRDLLKLARTWFQAALQSDIGVPATKGPSPWAAL
jgi:hypothetical protein